MAPLPLFCQVSRTSDVLAALTVSWYCLLLQERREKRDNLTKILAYGEAIFSLSVDGTAVFLAPDNGKNAELAYVFNETVC